MYGGGDGVEPRQSFIFLSFFMAFLVMNNNDDGIDLCLNVLTCCTVSKFNSPLFSFSLSLYKDMVRLLAARTQQKNEIHHQIRDQTQTL